MSRDSHVQQNQRKCVQVVHSTAENLGIHNYEIIWLLIFQEKKVKFVSMHTHHMDTET